MSLTDMAIRQAKPKTKAYKLFDGGGLYLGIQPNGGKWWRYSYRFQGKQNLLALGTYPDTSLAVARERHAEARKTLAAGNDPNEKKKAAKRVSLLKSENTFEAIAREWHQSNLHTWTPKHGANVLKRLEGDIFPKLGDRPITDINAPELLSALRIVEKRGALDLTQTIAQYCGRVFSYAIATGRCERNPAPDLRGALKTPVRKHHAYLKAEALPEYLQKLNAYTAQGGEAQTELALRMLLLTFVRTTELRGAEWTEIDFDKAEWRIPASRMKMKDPHIVPLCTQALDVLRELQKLNGHWKYVFPNENRPGVTYMSENTIGVF